MQFYSIVNVTCTLGDLFFFFLEHPSFLRVVTDTEL